MNPTTIGLVAGSITSIAAIPQVIKTLRTRHARDISIWQPLLLAIGVALWMVYGILIHDQPLILANIIPLLCNILLVGMKLYFDRSSA
ncbi:MAG: SemiSWEET transporter [Desulfuromonadales bacterium]|nr:SemiSWEET transporter [Desulfuromonadales bacterium]